MFNCSLEKIAGLYDRKVIDQNDINNLMGRKDNRFFNHSGIVCPSENTQDKHSVLDALHRMEISLVSYAFKHFDPLSESSLLLDAGCGSGGTSIMIHEVYGCYVEGFDISKKQIERANLVAKQLGYAAACSFKVGNMLNLPRQSEFYDFIVSCESSEHITDLSQMFNEFRRVIKSSGHLVTIAWSFVDTPLGNSIKKKIDHHYLTSIHSRNQYVASANANGWKVVNEVDLTSLTLPYWNLRKSSSYSTGSEEFFIEGYSTGNLEYYLLKFETKDLEHSR